jgi:hypothetical protein
MVTTCMQTRKQKGGTTAVIRSEPPTIRLRQAVSAIDGARNRASQDRNATTIITAASMSAVKAIGTSIPLLFSHSTRWRDILGI